MKKILLIILFVSPYLSYSQIEGEYEENDIEKNRPDLKKINDSLVSTTTIFYKIFVFLDVKENYKLKENKYLDVQISNMGCKDFYIPEWLGREMREKSEFYVEILKKDSNGNFENYKSKSETFLHEYDAERKIMSLKNRQSYTFKDIEFDMLNKITETGEYKINTYIDLSNFGYFKVLKNSSSTFKVSE